MITTLAAASCDTQLTWSSGLGLGLAFLGAFGGLGLLFWLMNKAG